MTTSIIFIFLFQNLALRAECTLVPFLENSLYLATHVVLGLLGSLFLFTLKYFA